MISENYYNDICNTNNLKYFKKNPEMLSYKRLCANYSEYTNYWSGYTLSKKLKHSIDANWFTNQDAIVQTQCYKIILEDIVK
jgi:hypothetical protein